MQTARPAPNLLIRGFRLGLRNWPCLVWVYAANLVFALLAAAPFTNGLSLYLDHSLEARKIAGTLDVGSLGDLWIQLNKTSFVHMVMRTAFWLQLLEQLVLFLLFAGCLAVFVSAEPPRFSALLRGGLAFFWRFVRAALLAGCVAVAVLGTLLGLRAVLLDHADAVYVERSMFLLAVLSGAVVLLVGLVVRLWWDLVEIYIVRNAIEGERLVRQAALQALRVLSRNFYRLGGSFLLAGIAGVSALTLCLYLWKILPAHQVWGATLLGQLGLFLLLAGRIWQRGIEVVFVMSIDPPRVNRDETDEIPAAVEEEMAAVTSAESMPALGDPTLRDLVKKLRNEPWANRDALPEPTVEPLVESRVESSVESTTESSVESMTESSIESARSDPDVAPEPLAPASLNQDAPPPADPTPDKLDPVREPYTVLLERHNAKLRLGGKPAEEALPEGPMERANIAEDPDQNSGSGKKSPKRPRS
ncbi:MAG: hypothetical protein WA510_05745 [Acidobacteriaceae bacterium]